MAQPALGALVDAALARRLRELKLESCTPPAAAPLARLLTEGSLAVLESSHISTDDMPLFDAAGAALVADALRMNTTLTKLVLDGTDVCLDMDAAGAFVGGLVGHPSLRELQITGESPYMGDRSALGPALGAVIAADAPALLSVDFSRNTLADAGLAPIVEALPLNRHLHTLHLYQNDMSEAFARERLLPAVRANTSLRDLMCFTSGLWGAAIEAEVLVCDRVDREEHG